MKKHHVRWGKPLVVVAALFHQTLYSQQDTLWYGHIAFGEGRYDEAITAYQAAINQGDTWDWLPELIQTVMVRRDLGNIQPADTHKIAMIFVTELNEITSSGTVSAPDVTAGQKDNWHVYFGVFRKTLESFSNGQWTVSIDTADAVATYVSGAARPKDDPDHLNLEEFFFTRMSDYDSFITFSNTRSPAFGLARRYPYLRGVLYGPHRGMAQINAGTHGYGVLLHEFFHIVEWVSNAIKPAHGYLDSIRTNFPGWTGTTEFDYYRWHFAETLPGVGWRRLNHRTRWIPFENKRSGFDSLQSVYSAITLENRQRADTLVKQGNTFISTDSSAAAAKWEEATALSPHHEEGLIRLREHYEFIVRDTVKTRNAYDKLKVNRSANDFFTVDTVNKNFGPVVGLWHREEIGRNTQFITTWKFVTWDISKYVAESGNYTATFYYTHGFTQLDMDSVSILEDGIQISLDPHQGVTGNVVTANNSYALSVVGYKPSSVYLLRARIKGGGGIDSYGQIHLQHSGPATSVEVFFESQATFHLSQNYPNPFNPTTTLRYTIPLTEFVSLAVYNALGQRVALLVNEIRSPGTYVEVFDAHGLPTGIYFYCVKAGIFTETKKLLLLR
ncbi:MAG: T9SS type A sorting domain-containing protein [Ignavibacteriales bacterium]|nr:T9SS type A sorting domain-containing protein [Ignavibacteriales bacterium]